MPAQEFSESKPLVTRRPTVRGWSAVLGGLLAALCLFLSPALPAEKHERATYVDLSLPVSRDYPCTWPDGFPLFQLHHDRRIGGDHPYNLDVITIETNTGTQIDVPAHSVPRPDSKLPNAGPAGLITTEKVPIAQFCGEACVIDCRDLLDSTPNGHSPLIKSDRVRAWEKAHRPLRAGDVVLFYTCYADRYYERLPAGRRFIADVVEGKAPAWPGPDPECMEYLAARRVLSVGTDGPTIGPIPLLGEPTHLAGLKHGMIFTEGLVNLGELPASGAFYCVLPPRHVGCVGAEARAFAIREGPLAERLLTAVNEKRVADLSVTLEPDLPVSWTGSGIGDHRQPYLKIFFSRNPNIDAPFVAYQMDSHAGTHLVPPAFALPPASFDKAEYGASIRQWLAEHEANFGPLGSSDATVEQVPVSQTCGPARIVDVRNLVGSTQKATWPASPAITRRLLQDFEKEQGAFQPDDVVIFRTGHTDRHFDRLPQGKALMADPLNGRSEGWPALEPDAVHFLAEKGIRCVAIDAPGIGGVNPRKALLTYWALGSRNMVAVEFLINLGTVPRDAVFLFAAPKIVGAHGGPGRAIAVY